MLDDLYFLDVVVVVDVVVVDVGVAQTAVGLMDGKIVTTILRLRFFFNHKKARSSLKFK